MALDRKALAIRLSRIPDHPEPKAGLEQVRTPGDVAADLLLAARDAGHIEARTVADLGCGTGVFAIGAALLGATEVLAVDVDAAAVAAGQAAAEEAGVAARIRWHAADVADLTPAKVQGEQVEGVPHAGDAAAGFGPVDTVVMNPPFGADLGSRARGGDRVFLSLAMRLAPVVYSLHAAGTERFLVAFARDAGFAVDKAGEVAFPLPGRFAHHRDLVRTLPVGIYRFTRQA